MKQKQILHNAHELVAIVPQVLGFRPKNRLVISVVTCGENKNSSADSKISFLIGDGESAKFTCPRCKQQQIHFIGPILSINLKMYYGKKLFSRVAKVLTGVPISLVSIDWYGEQISEDTNNIELLKQIQQIQRIVTSSSQPRKKPEKSALDKLRIPIDAQYDNPVVVSHLTDYQQWIETKYLLSSAFFSGSAAAGLNNPQDSCRRQRTETAKAQICGNGISAAENLEYVHSYAALEAESFAQNFIESGAPALAAANSLVQPRITNKNCSTHYRRK
ncbi:hypothetical protein RQN30_00375 [Arcanobacterium hippocoleae]